MSIRYQRTLAGIDWAELAAVVARAGLGTPDPLHEQRAYANSALYVFAFDQTTLIGAARAISDGIYHAQLCDMVVLPEWQGQGIGRAMATQILDDLGGIKVLLTASFGKEGFYRKLGFRRHKTTLARNYGAWWYADPASDLPE
ncbi:MAG: GNAT family N-acetyltransferase [Herpetosiphonaceae bacterium]|nr:GNAT family N-acetyltransferase [Herpetosiphonaceae bacterium]